MNPQQYQSLALMTARKTLVRMSCQGLLGQKRQVSARTNNGFKEKGFEFLSNFEPCYVTMYGVIYPSVENAYQASKCIYPQDRAQFLTVTAGQAKRLGKKVAIRPDFDSKKLVFMETLLRRKFSPDNPHLMQQLIATGDIELVEVNSWNDTFWGECNSQGQNNLGKLLMTIRQDLRQNLNKPNHH